MSNIGDRKENLKVCLCTLGKEENRYIREYIEHYKNYGVEKIFLYDNNDINGEHFESIINDYISQGLVEIFNWRGKQSIIYKVMNECYKKNNNKYDWILFYELDEFLHLYNYSKIKYFLKEKKFIECQIIYLNLIIHTDNITFIGIKLLICYTFKIILYLKDFLILYLRIKILIYK